MLKLLGIVLVVGSFTGIGMAQRQAYQGRVNVLQNQRSEYRNHKSQQLWEYVSLCEVSDTLFFFHRMEYHSSIFSQSVFLLHIIT